MKNKELPKIVKPSAPIGTKPNSTFPSETEPAGGFLSEGLDVSPYRPGLLLIGVAVLGALASLFVHRVPPADSKRRIILNPVRVLSVLREMRKEKGLFLSMVAISYFWAVGSLYQLNFGETKLLFNQGLNIK